MTTLADRFSGEIQLINKYMEKLIPVDTDKTATKPSTKSPAKPSIKPPTKPPTKSHTKPPAFLDEVASACQYSVINPGKRFRALLALITAKALRRDADYILPYAAAVELIHTYSLIHDDLPAMDNDDFRRGKPSHHKVYGEAMAIICGDALQALAFEHIAQNYAQAPELGLKAILILARASGYQGMVGGQAMDILISQGRQATYEDIEILHNLKTGRLIGAAIDGGATLCGAAPEQQAVLSTLGKTLGLAFQVADDILDHEEENPEMMGLPKHIGLESTKKMLDQLTHQALDAVENLGSSYSDLRFIVEFNSHRILTPLQHM